MAHPSPEDSLQFAIGLALFSAHGRWEFVGIVSVGPDALQVESPVAPASLPSQIFTKLRDVATGEWLDLSGIVTEYAPRGKRYLLTIERSPASAPAPTANLPERLASFDFFLSLPFVKLLPPESLASFILCLKEAAILAGKRFITQGDRGNSIYFLEKGSCEVIVDRDGREVTVATRKAGEMVGEMALITEEVRQAHVVAQSAITAWKLSRADFVLLVDKHHDLRVFLTELVTQRLEMSPHTADRIIGKYAIQHKLGTGAWSIVYDGQHLALGKRVAIKMLKHQMAMVSEFHARFIREAEIIARMGHRNIIDVYDIEDRFNTLFIIMEYLQGEGLDVQLKREGPLPVARVVSILKQVCAGLAYAHAQGIVHQDIKPANIFIQENGVVKILDFGLACPFGSENFEMEGTIQYMAPEQIESNPVDARTDLYCLGITAFELLAGKRPYPEDDLRALMVMRLRVDIPDPAESIGGLPEALSGFIQKCCRRNPEERYPSVEEALAALEEMDHFQGNEALAEMPVHMSTVHFFYNDAHKAVLTHLLEEFNEKVKAQGIGMRLVDYENYLEH